MSRVIVGIGAAIVVLWATLLGVAYAGSYSTEHTMTSAIAYLNGDPRDAARTCRIVPQSGPEHRIAVPSMPSRGLDINGVKIERWFSGSAIISCDQSVHLTQGAIVRFLPLVEQWLVLLLGLAVASGGMYRLGLFRHTSRHL